MRYRQAGSYQQKQLCTRHKSARVPAEFEAVYAACFAGCPESRMATHCWRTGWQDADTELSAAARQKEVAAEGREEEFRETLWTLYDIGGYVRVHGISFGEDRTEAWKQGWIDADINLGNGRKAVMGGKR